jgi:hypothetical protein
MAGRRFLLIAFGAQPIEFNMISGDFKSFALDLLKMKLKLGVYINDLPAIHTDKVMVGPRVGVEALLIGIHV